MNYLKSAWRTLVNDKVYTIIHVIGITLGITACLLIGTVVFDELSYDKQWSRSADSYRLLSVRNDGGAYSQKGGTVIASLAPALKRNFAEVEEYSEIYPQEIHLKIHKTDVHTLKAVMLHADSAYRQLLDIRILSHHDLTPTAGIQKVIISEKFRKTHFSGTDPLGLRIQDVPNYGEHTNEYVIAGVMEDLPPNTHLRADMILLKERTEAAFTNGGREAHYVRHYLLLRQGTDPAAFEQKINAWYRDIPENDTGLQFALQPMADIYLKTDFPAYQPVKGNIQHSYIFMGVAVLLLLIACINYINLSTARTHSRLKATGVRKLLGATRRDIMVQSLAESLLTFGLSGLVACVCYRFALPALQHFAGHPLAFSFGAGWPYLGGAMGTFLLICLLSGLYPAWLVSGFRATGSINQVLKGHRGNRWLREALVVLQFSISIGILVAMFVVQRQVDFLKTTDVGFDTNGLVSINHVSWDHKASALKAELTQHPDILAASFSNWLPTNGAGSMTRLIDDPRNPGAKIELWYISGDPDMAQTMGIRLTEGRFLSASLPGDAVVADDFEAEFNSLRPCLMTASTARLLGITALDAPMHQANLIPVGFVADFNSESLHNATVPTVVVGQRDPAYGALFIRCRPGTEHTVMRYVASVWNTLYPDKLLDMQRVEDTLAKQYDAETKLQHLFRLFSLLTMLLAALGVLGLIVHVTGLRTKEVGIRKVLGASVFRIVALLSTDFVKLVLLAVAIASPIAWWAMDRWLANFAYRTEITWWMFAVAGMGAIVIALFTVGLQALRAAMANPVDSLRDE